MGIVGKKILLMLAGIFILMGMFVLLLCSCAKPVNKENALYSEVYSSELKQTKSVSSLSRERLDSGKEYSYDYIIFSDISADSLHAKDGITLKTDFSLKEGEKVSWVIYRSGSEDSVEPAKRGVGYLDIIIDENNSNLATIKCLKPFSCVFIIQATYGNDSQLFSVAFSKTITSCDLQVCDVKEVVYKSINAFTSNSFNFGEMFFSKNVIFSFSNFEYSNCGYFNDNGTYLSAKLIFNENAIEYLSRYVSKTYNKSLIVLDGEFSNFIDCLKIENSDGTFSDITEFDCLIDVIKNYKGDFCFIEFLLDSQTYSFTNVFKVKFS